ncbi:ParB/RepB/Spo0J family partition protein [bacterium]|nr:ParB/RepB/Spo0J family partition protein [bacterium]
MNPKQDRVLGRGLSALISGATAEAGANLGDREASMVSLGAIGLNPAQPRKIFKDNALRELADSVRQVGVLQPILLRRLRPGDDRPLSLDDRLDPDGPGSGDVDLEYCLVAGERRLRAAQLAGIEVIPALICSYEEAESLKIALLENIQREDLNPLEEASAYQSLLDAYGATQEELSVMLGKSRTGVTNTLRLLSLEVEIQEMLQDERISRGHAKVLLGVTDPGARLRLARLCRNRGLSVRECEKRVRNMLTGASGRSGTTRKRARRAMAEETREVRVLRERVEARFGAPVQVERDKDGRGNIALRFFTDDDMLRILSLMGIDTDLS